MNQIGSKGNKVHLIKRKERYLGLERRASCLESCHDQKEDLETPESARHDPSLSHQETTATLTLDSNLAWFHERNVPYADVYICTHIVEYYVKVCYFYLCSGTLV